ncbi:hypothetical protein MPR_2142 [Myroides profundi]|nr:hypothetical protein MPR_2142 [Myroides profundi]
MYLEESFKDYDKKVVETEAPSKEEVEKEANFLVISQYD